MKNRTLVIPITIILYLSNVTFISNVNSQGDFQKAYIFSSKVLIENRGDNSLRLENFSYLLPIFINISGQTVDSVKTSKPYIWTEDIDENPVILMEVPSIPREGNETLTISLRIVKQSRVLPEIDFSKSMNISHIPLVLKEKYCKAEGSWLVDDATLRLLANEIWLMEGKTENVLKIVTGLADWIGIHILPRTHEIPYYANETYAQKEGDCDDQAILLITLCRILGIPAYLQLGCLNQPGTKEGVVYNGHFRSTLRNIAYHAWAMVYIPPWGWLPFDMTLGWERENPLNVITSAPIWEVDTIMKRNIIQTDWPGDGRRYREYLINSEIYVQYQDELIVQDSVNVWTKFLNEWSFWLFIVIIAPIAILLIKSSKKIFAKFETAWL